MPALTDNVKPQRDVGRLHRDHANDLRHSVAFHDGEVVEGLVECQRDGGRRRFLNPLNVEASGRRFLRPPIVNGFYLLHMERGKEGR